MEFMKLGLEAEAFQNEVSALRGILEEAKEKGELPKDFSEKLQRLKDKEVEFLTSLLPVYRSLSLNDENSREANIRTLIGDAEDLQSLNGLDKEDLAYCNNILNGDDGSLLGEIEKVIPQVSAVFQPCDSLFICGMEDGRILFVRKSEDGFKVIEMFQAMPDMVIEVLKLQSLAQSPNYDGSCNSNEKFIAMGAGGYISIFSMESLLEEQYCLEGEEFVCAASNGGSCLIASENGSLYYFEENFSEWQLREKPVVSNYLALKLAPYKADSYICINEDESIDIIEIVVPREARDLWESQLFTL